jgi:putative oxidoreductase
MSLSERIAPLIGRLAIAWLFLGEAWTMINSWDGTVTLMQMKHMPAAPLLLVIALAVMILGGVSIALGYHIRHGALLLFGFTVIVSVTMHDYWKLNEVADRLADSEIFMRNIAIAGGLLLLMGLGAGPFAIDNAGGGGKRGR